MRTGNLAEPVWRRSVFRQLNMDFSGICGQYGADCAGLGDAVWTSSAGPMPGFARRPDHQVTIAANRLAAAGIRARALLVQALLPPEYEEAALQEDMRQIARAAARHGMEITTVNVGVSSGVTAAQYSMTGLGDAAFEEAGEVFGMPERLPLLQPGQALLVTKWIALAGTAALARQHEEELKSRYPFVLIDRAKEFEKLVCVEDEARAINHFGTCAVHNLSEGGIFCALWEMAERAGVGLEVDLKKIPVKQETIELCEYFDINPYCLYSAGALLIGTDHAEVLAAQLSAKGIAASVIGRVTAGKERVLLNGEDRRYLDRPQQEEWYRRMENRAVSGQRS